MLGKTDCKSYYISDDRYPVLRFQYAALNHVHHSTCTCNFFLPVCVCVCHSVKTS